MNVEQFWEIIEDVHNRSDGDMEKKCLLLTERLWQLGCDEIRSFQLLFTEFYFQAYRYDLWDAAYLICGGCSDDGFMDFRSTLVSMGRKTFERALDNPDSLAEVTIDKFEGFQYVADKVLKEKCPQFSAEKEPTRRHPKLTGRRCKQWQMSKRFPKLAAKFNHDDSKYLYLKDRAAKDKQQATAGHRIQELMLDSGIVVPSGLIPPYRFVRAIMRQGKSPVESHRRHTWEPFGLQEDHYWQAVIFLERMTADQIKSRGDLQADKLKQDFPPIEGDKFGEWIANLRHRGLL